WHHARRRGVRQPRVVRPRADDRGESRAAVIPASQRRAEDLVSGSRCQPRCTDGRSSARSAREDDGQSTIQNDMKIGVPKEIKTNENRIAVVPAGAETLVGAGHEVSIETGAGVGSGFPDDAYQAVGAKIVPDAAAAWSNEMVTKVKEP